MPSTTTPSASATATSTPASPSAPPRVSTLTTASAPASPRVGPACPISVCHHALYYWRLPQPHVTFLAKLTHQNAMPTKRPNAKPPTVPTTRTNASAPTLLPPPVKRKRPSAAGTAGAATTLASVFLPRTSPARTGSRRLFATSSARSATRTAGAIRRFTQVIWCDKALMVIEWVASSPVRKIGGVVNGLGWFLC